jgi:glycosyltransferase involved in cell wall biosynthesis
MKIAFVNQPFDRIVPPRQNSLGICTYGAARALAKSAEVIVYGNHDLHRDLPTDFVDGGVRYRFLPSYADERFVFNTHRKLQICGVPMQPAPIATWTYPRFGRDVAMDLAKEHCDLIHIQNFSQYVPVVRAYNPDTKIVFQQHVQWYSQHDYRLLAKRLQAADLCATVSDHLTAVSQSQFPMLADRFTTIFNGVDPAEFTRARDAATGRKNKRILYAGYISPSKGVHVLLSAFKLLLRDYPDVELELAGPNFSYPLRDMFDKADLTAIAGVKPWYTPDYIARIKAHASLAAKDAGTYAARLKAILSPTVAAKVTFLGYLPHADLADRYADADIFAFPPLNDEAFGLPVLEAMAAGTPVVASRSGGIVDIIRDGETGMLVPKNDAQALADAMIALIENSGRAENMGQAARKRALDLFSWERVAERMYTVYDRLCGGALKSATVRSVASAALGHVEA